MCTDISMSIIEKVFHYEENEISVIKGEGEIWLEVRTLQKHEAIRFHVRQFVNTSIPKTDRV